MPEGTPLTACVRKWNGIACVSAIVAPHVCDLVRGAFVLEARARPACLLGPLWMLNLLALPFAKMIFLVPLNVFDVLLGPPPMHSSVHSDLF